MSLRIDSLFAVILLFGFAATVALLGNPPPSRAVSAALPGANGKIPFVSDRDGDPEIDICDDQ